MTINRFQVIKKAVLRFTPACFGYASIIVLTILGAFMAKAETAEPLFVLMRPSDNQMVFGSDSPVFALYSDGTVIFARKGQDYGSLKLSTRELKDWTSILKSASNQEFKKVYEDESHSNLDLHRQSTVFWFFDSEEKAFSIRVELAIEAANQQQIPKGLYELYRKVQSFESSESKKWMPKFVEIMLWPFGYAKESVAWPESFPQISDERTIQRRAGHYSLYLPSQNFSELQALNSKRKSHTAVELGGLKFAMSFRIPFPQEDRWMTSVKIRSPKPELQLGRIDIADHLVVPVSDDYWLLLPQPKIRHDVDSASARAQSVEAHAYVKSNSKKTTSLRVEAPLGGVKAFELSILYLKQLKNKDALWQFMKAQSDGKLSRYSPRANQKDLIKIEEKSSVGEVYDLGRGGFDEREPDSPDIFIVMNSDIGTIWFKDAKHLSFDWSKARLLTRTAVLTKQNALAIGRKAITRKFGSDVENYEPLKAKYTEGIWVIEGALASDRIGGVPVVKVAVEDGRVLQVEHTQ